MSGSGLAPTARDGALSRARAAAGVAADAGRWDSARDDEIAAAFEMATIRALQVPSFNERAVLLRRIARAVVPARLRPCARRAARVVDAALGRVSALR